MMNKINKSIDEKIADVFFMLLGSIGPAFLLKYPHLNSFWWFFGVIFCFGILVVSLAENLIESVIKKFKIR